MPYEVEHQIDLPVDELLRAKLQNLEPREIEYTDRKTNEKKSFTKLDWTFEVTQDGDYFGKLVKANTSAYLSDSPYNQFRSWSEALLGHELETGQVLSESDLIGLPALITVKYEDDKKDANKKWARVDEVLAVSQTYADSPPF